MFQDNVNCNFCYGKKDTSVALKMLILFPDLMIILFFHSLGKISVSQNLRMNRRNSPAEKGEGVVNSYVRVLPRLSALMVYRFCVEKNPYPYVTVTTRWRNFISYYAVGNHGEILNHLNCSSSWMSSHRVN